LTRPHPTGSPGSVRRALTRLTACTVFLCASGVLVAPVVYGTVVAEPDSGDSGEAGGRVSDLSDLPGAREAVVGEAGASADEGDSALTVDGGARGGADVRTRVQPSLETELDLLEQLRTRQLQRIRSGEYDRAERPVWEDRSWERRMDQLSGDPPRRVSLRRTTLKPVKTPGAALSVATALRRDPAYAAMGSTGSLLSPGWDRPSSAIFDASGNLIFGSVGDTRRSGESIFSEGAIAPGGATRPEVATPSSPTAGILQLLLSVAVFGVMAYVLRGIRRGSSSGGDDALTPLPPVPAQRPRSRRGGADSVRPYAVGAPPPRQ